MGPWIALTVLAGGVLYLLSSTDADIPSGINPDKFVRFIAGMSILAFVGSAVAASYRGRAATAVRHAFDWMLIFLLAIAAYTYRAELQTLANRVAAELTVPLLQAPEPVAVEGGRAARILRQWSGHFVARTIVNGRTIEMLIDTGASTVVLRTEDASRAGLDITRLNYTVPVQTANGRSYAAPVHLNSVSVGAVSLKRVEALVAKPGSLQTSLLGMSFLSRLRSYEFSGKYLTLRS